VMHSRILVPWRLSRAYTLRACAKSKKFCIAPWPKHGLRSENCACVSASRKRRHLSGNLTSRSSGGYSRQRDDEETGEFMLHTLALTLLHCLHSARDGVVREQPSDHPGIQIRPNFDDYSSLYVSAMPSPLREHSVNCRLTPVVCRRGFKARRLD
jgi:hypothetical protein